MDFSNKEIYNYIDNHSSEESDILYELRRETELKCLNPIMLSGKIQGNFLAIISKLIKPFNVLEIGTYTGYSTLCIAKGLNPVGMIHTIDKNEELLQIQNKYFEKSGLRNQIKQYTGDALAIIPKLKFDFDMVFLDADKENYVKYLELISPILKPGGVLLTDNVLWHGKILESSENQDRVTRLIDNFNKKILEDKSLKTVMLPIRDEISSDLTLSISDLICLVISVFLSIPSVELFISCFISLVACLMLLIPLPRFLANSGILSAPNNKTTIKIIKPISGPLINKNIV